MPGGGMAAGGFGFTMTFGSSGGGGSSSGGSSGTAVSTGTTSRGAVGLSDPVDPCSGKAPKTYYKCSAGMCFCQCPPGTRYLSTTDQCIDESSSAGGGASEAKAAKSAGSAAEQAKAAKSAGSAAEQAKANKAAGGARDLPASPPTVSMGSATKVSTEELPPKTRQAKTEIEEEQLNKALAPKAESRDNVPQGKLQPKTEPAELLPPKDVTGRPKKKVREFTVSETAAQLNQDKYKGFYNQFTFDQLASGGTEIRKDRYEVNYSPAERKFLESQFGCIIHPARHQTIINTVLMTFADEMLSSQVRSVESFTHIKNRSLSNSEITVSDLSEAAASVMARLHEGKNKDIVLQNTFGVFGPPKRTSNRAFSLKTSDPFGNIYRSATTLQTAGDKMLDMFKYSSSARAAVGPKSKLTAAPGGFKIGPGGFRMGAQMGAPGLLMPGRGGAAGGGSAAFAKMVSKGISVSKATAQSTRGSPFAPSGKSMTYKKSASTGNLQKNVSQGFTAKKKQSNMLKIQAGSKGSMHRGAKMSSTNMKAMSQMSNNSMSANRNQKPKSSSYMKTMQTKGGKY